MPPPLLLPLNYLPGLLAESMLHWDPRPSLPSPAQIMKTRLVPAIAHLHFLLIFSFQRKNERRQRRRRQGNEWVGGELAASPGPASSIPGTGPECSLEGGAQTGVAARRSQRQRALPHHSPHPPPPPSVRPRGRSQDPGMGEGALD